MHHNLDTSLARDEASDASAEAEHTRRRARQGAVRRRRPTSRALLASRVLDTLLLLSTMITVAVVVLPSDKEGEVAGLVALCALLWILLGLIYTAIRLRRIRKARKGDERWPGWLAGRRTSYLMTLGTAGIVLGNGYNVATLEAGDENNEIIRGFGIAMVLVAWAILQLSYTERYARLFLENTEATPIMDFPETPRPSLLEFAYFSFTVGTTFGTSDVTIQSSRLRGIVLCHGVLVFVYNTAVLGMVISLVSG